MVGPVRAGQGESARSPHITVALDATRIVAYSEDVELTADTEDGVWGRAIEAFPREGVDWPSFSDALGELRSQVPDGAGVVRLTAVLLWPLAETRTIELPAMRDDERLQVLTRSAPRYFLEGREQLIVGTAPITGKYSGSVVASAVSARMLSALRRAAVAAQFEIDVVQPSEAAWLAAARKLLPSAFRGRKDAGLLIVHEDRIDILGIANGALTSIRRIRNGTQGDGSEAAELALAARKDGQTRLYALGTQQAVRHLRDALAQHGTSIAQVSSENSASASPLALAARFASATERFRFRTNEALALREARASRVAVRLFAAAAAILLMAGFVEWWGVRRELQSVKNERAAIRSAVNERLSGEQQQSSSDRRVDAIVAQYNLVPQWSAAIASLTDQLGDDAYLLNLRTRVDTVLLDGLSLSAPAAFAAVEQSYGFTGVRSAGEMRIERQPDGTLLERFAIQARVVRATEGGQ